MLDAFQQNHLAMPEYATPRRHPRFLCERPLRFVLGRDAVVDGFAENVSQAGLGALIPWRLQAGDRLTVEIDDAFRGGSLLLSAVVRWRNQYTHGLELLHPTAFQQRVLAELGEPKKPAS